MFIEHGTRRMHLGGITANPTSGWTVQQARNLALALDERFEGIKFLLRDRGSNFTASFDRRIEDSEALARAHGDVFAETRTTNTLLRGEPIDRGCWSRSRPTSSSRPSK
jgi:hypothetical protein